MAEEVVATNLGEEEETPPASPCDVKFLSRERGREREGRMRGRERIRENEGEEGPSRHGKISVTREGLHGKTYPRQKISIARERGRRNKREREEEEGEEGNKRDRKEKRLRDRDAQERKRSSPCSSLVMEVISVARRCKEREGEKQRRRKKREKESAERERGGFFSSRLSSRWKNFHREREGETKNWESREEHRGERVRVRE